MDLEEMKSKLEHMLLHRRFIHSLNVMKTASDLAPKYGESATKAAIAGLLHDCARDVTGSELIRICKENNTTFNDVALVQPELLHGPAGAIIARMEFGINDSQILDAISYHTLGRENMNMLEKIVFIADYIEPGRSFPGVNKARKLAFENIDEAMLFSLDKTITFVIARGSLIHPDTVLARNYIIKNELTD